MKSLVYILPFIVCSTASQLKEQRHYNGYSVVRVVPANQEQLNFLIQLMRNVSKTDQSKAIDFWRIPSGLNQQVDLMVSPKNKTKLIHLLRMAKFKPLITIKDVEGRIQHEKQFDNFIMHQETLLDVTELVQTLIEISPDNNDLSYKLNKSRSKPSKSKKHRKIFDFFKSYKSVEEIYDYLDLLTRMDPSYMSIEVIGKSYEGKDLKVMRIGKSRKKPIVWVDGGTHAREWLSVTSCVFMAFQLAEARTKCFIKESNCDFETQLLLKRYDWILMPVLNPDGYEYSRTNDRLWRKTRSKHNEFSSIFCTGADPNRNYNFSFGNLGTSESPCSDIYHGGYPFSEPETFYQSEYIKSFTNPRTGHSRIKLYLSLHTYSQLMLLPWGHDPKLPTPPEYNDLEDVARVGRRALYQVDKTHYEIGNSAKLLYPSSGSATDWSFGELKIKYSYTFELRDKGHYGFITPAEFILPTGRETWAAAKEMAAVIAEELKENGGHTRPGSVRPVYEEEVEPEKIST